MIRKSKMLGIMESAWRTALHGEKLSVPAEMIAGSIRKGMEKVSYRNICRMYKAFLSMNR